MTVKLKADIKITRIECVSKSRLHFNSQTFFRLYCLQFWMFYFSIRFQNGQNPTETIQIVKREFFETY